MGTEWKATGWNCINCTAAACFLIMLQSIHTDYTTKLCLATFFPDRGTCLNMRHMIWISVIHDEINKPDELFGTLLTTTPSRIFPLQQCLSCLDLRLKISWKKKSKTKVFWCLSPMKCKNFENVSEKKMPFPIIQTLQETFNPLSVCLVIMIPLWCCLAKFAWVLWPLSIWTMRQYSEKHSPLIWEHNSE